MEYFDIFNKVLLELNYRPQSNFETIYKTEHTKVLANINRVNADVCSSFPWDFLENTCNIRVEPHENYAVEMPEGRVNKIFNGSVQLVFDPLSERFFNGSAGANTYGYFNNKILFAKTPTAREFQVFYSSNQYAKDAQNIPKARLEAKDDISIIPMPWCEQLLVYGTCLKTKANPQYPKFAFWHALYTDALTSLRSKGAPTAEDAPSIVLKRPRG